MIIREFSSRARINMLVRMMMKMILVNWRVMRRMKRMKRKMKVLCVNNSVR